MTSDGNRTNTGPPTSNAFDCRAAAQSHLEAGNVTSAGILERAADTIEAQAKHIEYVESVSIENNKQAQHMLAERDAQIRSYEDGITWQTSCLNCAKLWEKNYQQFVRLAEAKKIIEAVRQWLAVGDLYDVDVLRESLKEYDDVSVQE